MGSPSEDKYSDPAPPQEESPPAEKKYAVEVVIAPGWVKLGGTALVDMKKGDPIFLEPCTGNVCNHLPKEAFNG